MRKTFRGFTLVELLVVITIIVILMGIMMPAVQSIRANMRTTQCQNNLSQIGVGVKAYVAQSGNMRKFDPRNWDAIVLPFLSNQGSVTGCPELGSLGSGFGCNNLAHLFNEGDSRKILLLDFNNKYAEVVGLSMADADRARNWDAGKAPRHASMTNVLYNDGHVETKDLNEIDPVVTDIHAYWWLPYQRKFERAITYVDIPGLVAEYRMYSTHGGQMTWDGPADASNITLDLNLPFGSGHDNHYGDPLKHPLYPWKAYASDDYYMDPHTSLFKGQIKFPTTDDYRFTVGSDDQVWIWVDGNQVYSGGYTGGISQFGNAGGSTGAPFHVEGGKWYDFLAKHNNNPRTGTYMYVKWQAPSVPWAMVPTEAFRLTPP